MTGGQYAPTTPEGYKATTAPYGMLEPIFDICKLAEGAGATFVARSDAYHVTHLQKTMKDALSHKGFSVLDVLTSCPTQFGRRNEMADPVKMLERIRDITVMKAAADKMSPEELQGKYVIGEFVNCKRPELTEIYAGLSNRK
jgi:2-oxoglutarate ferredoxin oxidoreductase subunit beta